MPTVNELVSDEKKKQKSLLPSTSDSLLNFIAEGMGQKKSELSVPPKESSSKAIEAMSLSRATGVPTQVAIERMDEVKADRERMDIARIMNQSPSFANWMAKNPVNHAAGKEEVDKMGTVERIIRETQQSFENGKYTVELGNLSRKTLFGGTLTKEQSKRRNELKRLLKNSIEYDTGLFAGVPGAVGEQLPILAKTVGEGLVGAAAGATVGASVGLVGGPVGVGAGAGAGAAIGFKSGIAISGGLFEASLAYDDYQDIVDEEGNKIDSDLARGSAVVVGIINGSLELVGLSTITKTIPGLRALSRKGVKTTLKQLTKSSAFKAYAKAVGTAIAGEGSTEALQELMTHSGQTLLELHASGQLENMGADDISEALFNEKTLSIMKEAAIKGAQAGGGITSITTSASLGTDVYKAKKAQSRVGELRKLDEAIKDSKLNKEAPDQVGEIIEDITKEGDNSVYVDPEKTEEYFQSNNIELDEISAEFSEEIERAKEEGRDARLSLSSYITKLAGTEHGEFFQSEVKFEPDDKSAREATEFIEESEKEEVKRAEKETKVRKKEKAARVEIEKQLERVGLTGEAKKSNVAIYMEMFKNFSERSGVAIEKILERSPLKVSIGELGEVEGSLEQKAGKPFSEILDEIMAIENKSEQKLAIEKAVKDNKLDVDSKLIIERTADQKITIKDAINRYNKLKKSLDELEKVEGAFEQPLGKPFSEILDEVIAIKNKSEQKLAIEKAVKDNKLGADSKLIIERTADQKITIKDAINRYNKSKKSLEQKKRGRFFESKDNLGKRLFNIEFLEGADLSTFIHELGHYSLEVMGELALEKGANISFVEDYNKILNYIGAKDKFSITREQHEKFAESLEIYMREGKAPSKELQKAFMNFLKWLTSIYKDLTSFTNVNESLSDEIKEVFDRLLATDEQIAEARFRFGGDPLFSEKEVEGFTPKQKQAYSELQKEVEDVAKDQIEKKYRKIEERKAAKWWKDKKAVVIERIKKELNEDKGYMALLGLTKGELPSGTPVEKMKISKSSLLEFMTKDELKRLPRIFTSKKGEGVDAGQVAEFFGFNTAEEMIEVISNLKPFEKEVDARADTYMNETYLETSQQETELAVSEAVNNEKRESVIRLELKHLLSNEYAKFKGIARKIVGHIPSSSVIARQAQEIIARKQIRHISPIVYQNAQKKAARKSLDALLKGDISKAFSEKKKQLLAFHLWKESVRVRSESDKGINYLKKFTKRSIKEKIGKVQGGYLDQIEGLLEKISIKKISVKEKKKRKSLLKWVEEQKNVGEPIIVSDKVLSEAIKVDYRDLLSGDFNEIIDTIKQIEAMANLKGKLITEKGKRDLRRTADDLISSIKSFHKEKKLPNDYNPSFLKKSLDIINSFVAQHKKVEFIVTWLDGNKDFGAAWRTIFQPMVEANAKKDELTKKGIDALDAAFSHYTKSEMKELYTKKINIREEFRRDIFSSGYNQKDSVGALTKQQIITIGLHMRNEYNKTALMDGEKWNGSQLRAILLHLTKKDIETINKIGDVMESYWPDVANQQKELVGIAPKKVEGENVELPNGVIKGGYTPIIFDPSRSVLQEKIEERNNVMDLYGGGYAQAMTSKGHTIERRGTAGKPLLLDLQIVSRHLEQVSHDLAYRVPVINVNKVLNDKDLQNVIINTLGRNTEKQLRTWLHATASNQQAQSIGKIGRFLSYIRQGQTVAVMGFSLRTALLQPFGYFLSARELGYKWALNGLWQAFGNPAKIIKIHSQVIEKSSFMKNRFGTVNRDIHDAIGKIDKSGKNVRNKLMSKFFYPIGLADMAVSLPTWLAAYNKALLGEIENIEALNEKEAIEYADSLIRITQGDGAVQNLSAIQRGDEFQRYFTMYMSFFSVSLNQFMKSTGQLKLDGVKGAIPFLNAMMLTQLLPELLSEILLDRMDEEDEENIPLFVAKTAIKAPLRGVVGMRDVVSYLEYREKGGKFAPTPLIGSVEKVGQAIDLADKVIKGEEDEVSRYEIKSTVELVGVAAQLPTAQVWRTSEYFWRWLNGDENPDNAGELLYRAALTGPKKKEKGKRKR